MTGVQTCALPISQKGELFRIRADSLYKLRQPEKALEDYAKALELNPKDAIGFNNRGLVFHESKDLDKALEDYNTAINLDPTNPAFYENRALIFVSKGQHKQAIEDYQRAIKNLPDEKTKLELTKKISTLEEMQASGANPSETNR